MNIFYLDHNPVQAAQWMVDKHVVKMILESAQLLSTAHRILDGTEIQLEVNVLNDDGSSKVKKKKWWLLNDSREETIYAATHINHPSAIWCRSSIENYNWLVDHFFALMQEYTYRYDKEHKCFGELSYMLQSPPKNLQEFDLTVIPSAMPDECKISEDPVINYRCYYNTAKRRMFSWKKRETPPWILN